MNRVMLGLMIGVLIGGSATRGQNTHDVRVSYFSDVARLKKTLGSQETRGYIAGAYDGWMYTTARSDQGERISSCAVTQQSLKVPDITGIIQAYLIKHPASEHTPAFFVVASALNETCGIE